ncbi:MAG: iron-sulfur cluster assembly protein IscA [Candidatus Contendobacter odensis]|uniref:Iron-sulfur cluster assembly protein IscA n=1 Tax=Candidatus Contendibacter odensensis TaxID=1400860 RepID=A0A2G6PG97_9GAMM|nr:MAG: iron-sulfur cluster assembly protein IscA [Candidatus Contendobacter odensis]
MSITLTEKAAAHARNHLAKKATAQGLRLGVRNSGCSGFMYMVELAETINPDDQIFESKGIKLIVSNKNTPYLDGIEIDYGKQGLNESFHFKNPNAKATCGCGESFSV